MIRITEVKQDRRRARQFLFRIWREDQSGQKRISEYVFDYWTQEKAEAAHATAIRVLDASGAEYEVLDEAWKLNDAGLMA